VIVRFDDGQKGLAGLLVGDLLQVHDAPPYR
jgi:hypothetical protein